MVVVQKKVFTWIFFTSAVASRTARISVAKESDEPSSPFICSRRKWASAGENTDFSEITCLDTEENFNGCCFQKCSDLTGDLESVRTGLNTCKTKWGERHGVVGNKSHLCGSFGKSADSECCIRRRPCLESNGVKGQPDELQSDYADLLNQHCQPACSDVMPDGVRITGTSNCGSGCHEAAPAGKICVHNMYRKRGGHTFVLKQAHTGKSWPVSKSSSEEPVCFDENLTGMKLYRKRKRHFGAVLVQDFSKTSIRRHRAQLGARTTGWDFIVGPSKQGDRAVRFFKRLPEAQKYSKTFVKRPSLAARKDVRAASWMSDLFKADPSLKIREMCIPGSHDAVTYHLQDTYMKKCRWCKNLAKTQDLDFMEQLSLGTRYFDLRVDSDTNGLHTKHGDFPAVPVDVVFMHLRVFLHRHPREIVLLDFQEIPADKKAVQALRKQVFDEFTLVPKNLGFDLTVSDIWNINANVIALWDVSDVHYWDAMALPDSDEFRQNELLWAWHDIASLGGDPGLRAGAVQSAWARTMNVRELNEHVRQQAVDVRRKNAFHVSQMIMTPVPGAIKAESITKSFSIRKMQSDLDLASLIYGTDIMARNVNRTVNVVMSDFVHEHQLYEACVELNRRMVRTVAPARPGTSTAAELSDEPVTSTKLETTLTTSTTSKTAVAKHEEDYHDEDGDENKDDLGISSSVAPDVTNTDEDDLVTGEASMSTTAVQPIKAAESRAAQPELTAPAEELTAEPDEGVIDKPAAEPQEFFSLG